MEKENAQSGEEGIYFHDDGIKEPFAEKQEKLNIMSRYYYLGEVFHRNETFIEALLLTLFLFVVVYVYFIEQHWLQLVK